MQRNHQRCDLFCVGRTLAVTLLIVGGSGCGGGNARISRAAPLGSWGTGASDGDGPGQGTLILTATGGQLLTPCSAPAELKQPIIPDSNGHFVVTGTTDFGCCTFNVSPAQFEGTVANNVMTLTVTNPDTHVTVFTCTLHYGKKTPAFTGGCPG